LKRATFAIPVLAGITSKEKAAAAAVPVPSAVPVAGAVARAMGGLELSGLILFNMPEAGVEGISITTTLMEVL
jgi:hypothetical protein